MRRRDGSTCLTTTARFAEMFGCPHADIKRAHMVPRSSGVLRAPGDEEAVPVALKDLRDAHDLLDV